MTTENNKIIAEFMIKQEPTENFCVGSIGQEVGVFTGIKTEYFKYEDLKFHSDWNWLMEVVEKIENLPSRTLQGINYLGNEVKIYKAINTNTHYCEINLVKESGYRIVSIQFNKESKIKSVYDACLEFIKWYNEQNKV